jgi:hypothetical protein
MSGPAGAGKRCRPENVGNTGRPQVGENRRSAAFESGMGRHGVFENAGPDKGGSMPPALVMPLGKRHSGEV